MSPSRLIVILVGLVVLPGCGSSEERLVSVAGQVKLKGQPLEKVRVEFWPLGNGPQSAALTDNDGKFVLETLDGTRKGAVVGRHKVVLKDMSIVSVPFAGRKNEGVDMTGGKKPRTADKYTNVSKTPIEVEIAGDKSDLVIEVDPHSPGR